MHRDCKRLQCAQNKQTFLSSSSKISGSMKIFFIFFENRWKWLSLYRRKSVHIILSRINALLFANISNEFHDAKTKAKHRLNLNKKLTYRAILFLAILDSGIIWKIHCFLLVSLPKIPYKSGGTYFNFWFLGNNKNIQSYVLELNCPVHDSHK